MTTGSVFTRVAAPDDLADDEQRVVVAGGRRLLLCRSQGQYFAIDNRCTHDDEPLAGGRVFKCSIICPVHGARFSLKSGRPFGPPAFEPVGTYVVRLTEDAVEVEVPA